MNKTSFQYWLNASRAILINELIKVTGERDRALDNAQVWKENFYKNKDHVDGLVEEINELKSKQRVANQAMEDRLATLKGFNETQAKTIQTVDDKLEKAEETLAEKGAWLQAYKKVLSKIRAAVKPRRGESISVACSELVDRAKKVEDQTNRAEQWKDIANMRYQQIKRLQDGFASIRNALGVDLGTDLIAAVQDVVDELKRRKNEVTFGTEDAQEMFRALESELIKTLRQEVPVFFYPNGPDDNYSVEQVKPSFEIASRHGALAHRSRVNLDEVTNRVLARVRTWIYRLAKNKPNNQ